MAVFFLFLRNVLLPIEILKIKILEHSDPPSQHFSVHKAFSHSFFCRGKVVLCHPAEWHKTGSEQSVQFLFIGQWNFDPFQMDQPKTLLNSTLQSLNTLKKTILGTHMLADSRIGLTKLTSISRIIGKKFNLRSFKLITSNLRKKF